LKIVTNTLILCDKLITILVLVDSLILDNQNVNSGCFQTSQYDSYFDVQFSQIPLLLHVFNVKGATSRIMHLVIGNFVIGNVSESPSVKTILV